MKVIFHEEFYSVYTSDPAAAQGRIESIVNVIEPRVEFIEPEPATEDDIAAVHTIRHIEQIKKKEVYPISALAAGGAILAANIGLNEPSFGLVRPPGHHASSDSCWGFCFFNNMAIAIESLKRQQKIETAFILDIDLHYGDGTVNILGASPYVTVYNPDAYHRSDYMRDVSKHLERCSADIIGISAGFDNHVEDWGNLLMTDDYRDIGKMVRDASLRNGGGCFAILEGGYNHRVLGANVMALIEGLSGE